MAFQDFSKTSLNILMNIIILTSSLLPLLGVFPDILTLNDSESTKLSFGSSF